TSSMLSKTSLEIACNRQDSQKAQNTVNQSDVQIDRAAGDMRVKRNERNRNYGQHVDCRNAVYRGLSENQTQHAKRDPEKDQNRRGGKSCVSQRSSSDVLRMRRQWHGLLRRCLLF